MVTLRETAPRNYFIPRALRVIVEAATHRPRNVVLVRVQHTVHGANCSHRLVLGPQMRPSRAAQSSLQGLLRSLDS